MINEYEISTYLVDELPEIKNELEKSRANQNAIKSIQCLVNYTKNKVIQHNLRLVRKCFAIAENFHTKGNRIVKDAVENVFIYSFSSILNHCGRDEKIEIQSLMPLSLYSAYVQQILKSGI